MLGIVGYGAAAFAMPRSTGSRSALTTSSERAISNIAGDDMAKVRVQARSRLIAGGVPDDAQPGDLVVGNRGAAARVIEVWTSSGLSSCLVLSYAGNYRDAFGPKPDKGRKLYDFS